MRKLMPSNDFQSNCVVVPPVMPTVHPTHEFPDMLTQRTFVRLLLLTSIATAFSASISIAADDQPLRIGIIGLDPSHVVAFTAAFEKAKPGSELFGMKVVAAYAGGSPDVESSRTRVEGFTKKLKDS